MVLAKQNTHVSDDVMESYTEMVCINDNYNLLVVREAVSKCRA